MTIFLYRILVYLLTPGIKLAALFSPKAKEWIKGRKNWKKEVETIASQLKNPPVWIHCASLGEYEMARPLIREINRKKPETPLVISFFSPSGYQHAKLESNCQQFYLPADHPSNGKWLIKSLQPLSIVFVKYDIWFNLIQTANQWGIPTYLIGFHPKSDKMSIPIYGSLLKNAIGKMEKVYTLTESGVEILQKMGFSNVKIGGDSRYKNVLENAKMALPHPAIKKFAQKGKTMVCGSIWKEDIEILLPAIERRNDWKWVIAPHEVSTEKIKNLQNQLPKTTVLLSDLEKSDNKEFNGQILIIDSVGMLAANYQLADLAYVGGGFGNGLHNILEPAAFGVPVFFGPKHHLFPEAATFIKYRMGLSISSAEQIESYLLNEEDHLGFAEKDLILKKMKEFAAFSESMSQNIISSIFQSTDKK